ncbi:type VI secretion system ATPase TssH [Desulfobacter curvatus]|uniref:type VI secretion system ATPase TssH n=1 Tax=Desulfobacter curvatus TaxID=2290 RepID=UPI00036973E6|nr:type VI secretion system ATPase TssH [Desulfobacter curvatus]
MVEIKRTVLFGKLNSLGYKSLESATVFCKMRGNPCVEIVHWFQQLLQHGDCDVIKILNHFDVDQSRLAKDVTTTLEKLPTGASSVSSVSPHLDEILETAWTFATLMFDENCIRTGQLIIAMLNNKGVAGIFLGISPELSKIKLEPLTEAFYAIVSGSVEDSLGSQDGKSITAGAGPGEASGAMAPAQMGKQQALAQFSVDLTQKAREGEMDPILGRDDEIRQIIDILMRRKQNNPILTGEAGVGKTAVVEGFAQKIAAGDVPPSLRDVTIRSLDIGLLSAGASMKGEFENRLKQVIEEVQSSATPIILFIDEAHTLIGAGGSAGTGDAANLLKPELARGTLRTIAATTWAEYKKYFEKDPALTRRFQVVKIEEPSQEKALLMIRGLARTLEAHHKVMVLDEALYAAVSLSSRYIAGRQLPDKAVSLIDTACARTAVSQHTVPPQVDNRRKRIQTLETELSIIENEQVVGFEHDTRKEEVAARLASVKEELLQYEAAWEKEKKLVDEILDLRAKLRGRDENPDLSETTPEQESDHEKSQESPTTEELFARLKQAESELAECQGDSPLIASCVDAVCVGSVVEDWTGIPVGGMVKDEVTSVLTLADRMEQRVVGQRHALEDITKRLQTSRAGVDNPNKPVGVFLLAGPSGVGKTETALCLAEAMYGGEQNLITINMSEFQEAHTVSTLKGAPPGYVGYGEGGILTEAVRRHPYSVVLLDEVEKAHPDVHEIFFQVFDKGMMEDGEGRLIDFKNTIILLTCNVGSDLIMNLCKDPELMPDAQGIAKALRPSLLKVFPAALLGRLVTIPYYPISDEMLDVIIKLQLKRIQDRLKENRNIELTYKSSVLKLITERCTELESGARMVDTILTNTLLPAISHAYLTAVVEGKEISKINVSVSKGDFSYKID